MATPSDVFYTTTPGGDVQAQAMLQVLLAAADPRHDSYALAW